jgi:hypothetical protein
MGGNVNCAVTMEKNMRVPQKTKNKNIIWFWYTTLGYSLKESKPVNTRCTCNTHVYHGTIDNSQVME